MRYVALDVGSSFIKGAILDARQLTVSAYRQTVSPPNQALSAMRCEIDAERLFQTVQAMLDELLGLTGDAEGILLCTQMHGYVLTDALFRPVSPYVTWQDRASLEPKAGGSTLEDLRKKLREERMACTGVPVKANLAMCSLAARGMPPKGALFCTVGGYLIGRLCGEHVCHIQNAAPAGMVHIEKGCWQEDIIRIAGLNSLRFPQIVSGLQCCGEYVFRGKRYSLYPDFGDHQVCVLGSLLREEVDLSVNIGTAGLIGSICSAFERGAYETRPYFDGLYLKTISGLTGGRKLNALVEETASIKKRKKEEVWTEMTALYPETDADEPWKQSVLALYKEIGSEYREASQKIGGMFERVVFAGGCVGRNPALRAWIERMTQIDKTAGSGEADSMQGMLQLAMILAKRAKNISETREILLTECGRSEE